MYLIVFLIRSATYLFILFWRFGPPICTVLIWVSRFALWLNVAPHISHVFGFRPKWTPFICSSSFSFEINPLGHLVHRHGFLSSGVWRLKIWNWRFFFDVHTYRKINWMAYFGEESKYYRTCIIKTCLGLLFTFPHSSHWHSSCARLKCRGRADGCLNSFPHLGHGTWCLPCSVTMCSFNASGRSCFPHSLHISILSSPLWCRNLKVIENSNISHNLKLWV